MEESIIHEIGKYWQEKKICNGCEQTVYPEQQSNMDLEDKEAGKGLGRDKRTNAVFCFGTGSIVPTLCKAEGRGY
jgi:hypothetical protein